jgi:hypothetical protein
MDADAVEVIGGGNEEDISMNAATVDDGDDAIDDVMSAISTGDNDEGTMRSLLPLLLFSLLLLLLLLLLGDNDNDNEDEEEEENGALTSLMTLSMMDIGSSESDDTVRGATWLDELTEKSISGATVPLPLPLPFDGADRWDDNEEDDEEDKEREWCDEWDEWEEEDEDEDEDDNEPAVAAIEGSFAGARGSGR